jgi:NAD(P)-dependent dehydrogenase (short-subunit alcohol dehydrogenase family)
LVSGGASGLGAATVRRLSEAGIACTILDRDAGRAGELAASLGPAASYAAGDVTDPEVVAGAVEKASQAGPLRIVVNCAGIGWAMRTVGRDGTPHDLEAFKNVISVNLIGSFNVIRLAASAMSKTEPLKDGERGVIVNTASVAAFEGQVGQVAYSASKGGIVGMTVPVARDLSVAGIRVLAIAPGLMDTPMLALLPEDQRKAMASGIPFPKRLGSPEDYAELVVDLCESSYLNGEVIRLDGALRLQPK